MLVHVELEKEATIGWPTDRVKLEKTIAIINFSELIAVELVVQLAPAIAGLTIIGQTTLLIDQFLTDD